MRASNPDEVSKRWQKYGLPLNILGKDFLDVGCWGGGFLIEAMARGALRAVGVDSVRSLSDAVDVEALTPHSPVRFFQMDIYSPHWFSLPRFDVVLCAGVLYHVPDPVGFFHRLKAVMKDDGVLFLETGVIKSENDGLPIMEYLPNDTYDRNFSNWFFPNVAFLESLLFELGFSVRDSFPVGGNRKVFQVTIRSGGLPSKTLPRKKGYM